MFSIVLIRHRMDLKQERFLQLDWNYNQQIQNREVTFEVQITFMLIFSVAGVTRTFLTKG